jgi:ABC-type multidrug transport system permease subunit
MQRYFIAQTILEIPIIIVESIVFGVIMYWMCGLNPEANRFIYFLLMLIVYAHLFTLLLFFHNLFFHYCS